MSAYDTIGHLIPGRVGDYDEKQWITGDDPEKDLPFIHRINGVLQPDCRLYRNNIIDRRVEIGFGIIGTTAILAMAVFLAIKLFPLL